MDIVYVVLLSKIFNQGGNMFSAIKAMIFGGKPAKERRRLARAGKLPAVGTYIAKQHTAIKVTDRMPIELWDWFVLMGWREVDVNTNRRKIRRMHDDTYASIAQAKPIDREAVYRAIMQK